MIRPLVREAVGAELQWGNFETIIGDHELEQGEVAGMYRDPRGTLYHPHRRDSIPLGTLQVERYRARNGPSTRSCSSRRRASSRR